MAMLGAQQRFAADESVKDRALEEARIALQGRQIEMQGQAMTFDQIQQAVAAGQIDAGAAVQAVQQAAKGYGITIQAPDPNAVYSELDRDYKLQQYQWAQTNPEDAVYRDAQGNEVAAGTPGATFGGLKDEAAGRFNEFLNTSYYGPDGKPVVGGADLEAQKISQSYQEYGGQQYPTMIKVVPNAEGGTSVVQLSASEMATALRNADQPNNANNATYQQILASAPTLNVKITSDTHNLLSAVPEDQVVNVNGRLMVTVGGRSWTEDGRIRHQFTVMDLATGQQRTFNGSKSGDNSVLNMNTWATDLGTI